jgi:hypothetical protein
MNKDEAAIRLSALEQRLDVVQDRVEKHIKRTDEQLKQEVMSRIRMLESELELVRRRKAAQE